MSPIQYNPLLGQYTSDICNLTNFKGLAPGYAPTNLDTSSAQVANNCTLASTVIRPVNRSLHVDTPTKVGVKRSIFPYGSFWLHWLEDVDVARSPIANDQYGRIYWTGQGKPKYSVNSLVTSGGGTDYPTVAYDLGLPSPANATVITPEVFVPGAVYSDGHIVSKDGNIYIAVTVDAPTTIAGGAGLPNGTYKYLVTFVTPDGETTRATQSDPITVALKSISLTAVPVGFAASGTTARRIYRTKAGGSTFYLLTTISDNSTTTFLDNVADATLVTTYAPPNVWNRGDWKALEVNQIQAFSYVWRYVTVYGEEGPPSLPTTAQSLGIGQTRTLTSCPTAPAGYTGSTITKKRLYRTLTGSAGTDFRFCLEADIATTTIVDNVLDSALGETLPAADWIAPPADLKGIINLANSCLAAFTGNILCLTPPNEPHAWPLEYQYTFPYPIVSIGAFGNTILVTTTGVPYIVVGTDPSDMRQERLEEGEACLSKRGLVDMGDSILYPSALGLMQVGGNSVTNLTKTLMTGKEWLALFKPSLLSAYLHEGRYIAFHDTGGFVFDPLTGALTTLDLVATAGYHDPLTAHLYLQVGNDIVEHDHAGAGPFTFTWRGKREVTTPVNPGAAKVQAGGYPVTFKLYGDGVLRWTQTVTSDRPFRLPGGYKATNWEVEMSGIYEITAVKVAKNMREL